MPEGDAILRTALTLDRWIGGREITAARSAVPGVSASRLVGRRVLAVEAQGKHVLVRFGAASASPGTTSEAGQGAGELTLRTHQRMAGSWHVAPAGARWRRPAWQAQVVLEAGDRVAVCFNAPVVELFPTRETAVHPVLRALGPDVLAGPIPAGVVWSRAADRSGPDVLVGELLLDQRVVAGIGNIWRAESLFVCGIDPWTPWPAVGPDGLDRLVATAAELMRAQVPALAAMAVPTGPSAADPAGSSAAGWLRPSAVGRAGSSAVGPGGRRWVYRRQGRPCWRCRTAIRSARLGRQARTVWWCPTCQAAPVE
jgi:endonuclease-8